MLPAYGDIRARIAEPPFMPKMLGVYDDFAVLAEIACQSCGGRFLVGGGWTRFDVFADPIIVRTLAGLAESFDYGDPPSHDAAAGRCAGETMSSDVVRIVEAWERVELGWVRRDEMEGPVPR